MIRWLTSRPFQYRAHTYHWRTDGERWELVTAGRVVAKVVPDGKYARMWRIDLGDGILSDMVNLPRAKDAAMRRVDAMLDATKPAVRGSPMRQNGLAVLRQLGEPTHALEPSATAEFGEQNAPADHGMSHGRV
jgi:hypothetical protein